MSRTKRTWRCFHCGELFTNRDLAAAHFGINQLTEPGCAAALRHGEDGLLRRILELEEDLRRYREDDSDILRWRNAKVTQHAAELNRVKEVEYARGLKEAQRAELMKVIALYVDPGSVAPEHREIVDEAAKYV